MRNEKFLKSGSMELNVISREALVAGVRVPLRNQEFALLKYFLENSGMVLTRARLLEEVWDRNICCSTNTVDVHVYSLRKKLQNFGLDGFIRTVHCIGYMLES